MARAAQKAQRPTAAVRPSAANTPDLSLGDESVQAIDKAGALTRLRTSGAFVVAEDGAAVSLRGVSVQGLDSCAPAAGRSVAQSIALDDAGVTQLTDLWGVNLIRLPIQASTLQAGTGPLSAHDLLAGVDDLAGRLADSNVYTLLAVRFPAPGPASAGPFPDPATGACLAQLATRYSETPSVLFELSVSAAPTDADWASAILALVGIMRQAHPASLLFVGDGRPTTNAGCPLLYSNGEPAPNLIYAVGIAPQTAYSPSDETALAAFSRGFPVVATDWASGTGQEFDRSAEAVAATFGRCGLGWAASSWNAAPRLVVDPTAANFAPTRWGSVVQRAMSAPRKLPLTMLLRDSD